MSDRATSRWRVPLHWSWTSLGEIGRWASGGTPSRGRPEFFGGGIPWVKTGELADAVVRSTEETLSAEGVRNSSAKVFPSGTLLVAMYGATIGMTGQLAVPAATNQACAALLPDLAAGITLEYVWHFLVAQRSPFRKVAQGGAQPNISQAVIKAWPIPVPPLPEQAEIVAAIETHFSRLDAAVASLTRAKAKLKRARASVLKAAVEGRLVPTEAALARVEGRAYEPASVLLARILAARKAAWVKSGALGKYVEPAKPETGALRELPEGWCWANMDGLAQVVGGITKDAKQTEGRLVPYLRVANVQRGRLDLSVVKAMLAPEVKIAALKLLPGDILMNEGGDRDKLGRGWVWRGEIPECIHQNHVFRARLWLAAFKPEYLSHYANTEGDRYFVDQGKQTTNLASISLSNVKALPVALPPGAEIARILAEVDRRLSVLDALETSVDANLARSARLRQSILKQAFEGRLTRSDATAPRD